MSKKLLLWFSILTFLLFGRSNVQVGFGVSINVNHFKTTDNYIEFQIVDENGIPLSSITLQVEIDDHTFYVKTDEKDFVRIYIDLAGSTIHSI